MNVTVTIADAGPYPYAPPMTETLIGYARCSTDRQELAAQCQALLELGVTEGRIYTDHGHTGTNRARPGLDLVIAATFAEFEADLICIRTREGMAIARARGQLRGKQPKLSDRQQR